jgi:hypothetical protein
MRRLTSLFRARMKLARVRYVAEHEPIEGLRGQPVPLAPPEQSMPPCAANFTAQTFQPSQIAWNCVIVEIALHHMVQPPANVGDAFMPPAHESGPNGRQFGI